MMKKFVFILFMSFITTVTLAQEEKKHVREGNKLYREEKFNEAEKSYQKTLEKKNDYYKALFNLGDAYYKQGKYEEAANQFEVLANTKTGKDTLAQAYHNLGNALLKTKKYEESVKAYKNALKNNPKDEDTRYNLAYAQKMLQQQQQQNKDNKDNKDNNDKKDNKDQNKDKKNDDKSKDQQQDKKEKDKQQNKQQEDQQKQEEQQKNEISKEDAQRLLEALKNEEKDLQDKVKKKKSRAAQVQIEKDW